MPETMNADVVRMRKKKKHKFITPKRVFILFVSVLFACTMFVLVSQALQMMKLEKEINLLQQQIASLQAENTNLKREKELLQTDAYIEKIAREQLGLVKPGEKVYLPTQPDDTAKRSGE